MSKKTTVLDGKIGKMKLHEFAMFPVEQVSLSFNGEEIEFILSTLNKVHTSLITTLRDKATPKDEHQTTYDFALQTELLYGKIFTQLKLYKPERQDLN